MAGSACPLREKVAFHNPAAVPELARRTVEISHPPAVTGLILPRSSVIFSANPLPGISPECGFSAVTPADSLAVTVRHATCFSLGVSKNHSQSAPGSVNFGDRSAKTATGNRGRAFWRGGVGRTLSGGRCGWNHGAARNGYRKRTRVRVACGVTIRPRGVGIFSSHGHFGRSVVGGFLFAIVLEPVREESLRRGLLSSGAGVPAAALTTSFVGFVRMPAQAGRTVQATRRHSAVVNRATSVPEPSVGMSGGWRRRTRPDPRMRLRPVKEN